MYKESVDLAYKNYKTMINAGLSKETARGILPACTYTSFVMTISLQALIYFIDLRKDSGAQSEIRLYAEALKLVLEQTHPTIYKILYKKL